MVNYNVTSDTVGPDSLSSVASAMETTINAITNTKTIHAVSIEKLYGDKFVGYIIYDV